MIVVPDTVFSCTIHVAHHVAELFWRVYPYTSVRTLNAELILAVLETEPVWEVLRGVPREIVVPEIVPIVEVTVWLVAATQSVITKTTLLLLMRATDPEPLAQPPKLTGVP